MGVKHSPEYSVFLDLIDNNRPKFKFFHLTEKTCLSDYDIAIPNQNQPTVIAFRKFDSSPLVYQSKFDAGALGKWIWEAITPVPLEYSEQTHDILFN